MRAHCGSGRPCVFIGIITNERGADRICAATCADTCIIVGRYAIIAFGCVILIGTVWDGHDLLRAVRWI